MYDTTAVPFSKYHALGNSYLVLDGHATGLKNHDAETFKRFARVICSTNQGIGSDGLLLDYSTTQYALCIFNPDGSEAEKSGNGLRIFARWLFDTGRVGSIPFSVSTLGGTVTCSVADDGGQVRVEMGRVTVGKTNEALSIPGHNLVFTAADVGNPHCVLIRDSISERETCELGPFVEKHPRFPQRTNVQFVKVLDRDNIHMQIWERGAGYTLSSGSSSCAAVAVCHALGRVDTDIAVHMPGGTLLVTISPEYRVTIEGPVEKICTGDFLWNRTRVI